jgi:hypothetical protein
MALRSFAIVVTCVVFVVPSQEKAAPKPRVFVTDSKSWETAGVFVANSNGGVGVSRGGARPQTAEIIKTVGDQCPDVMVTLRQASADFVLMLDHEGGKGLVRNDNKWALFNKDGDAIGSGSTRALGNSVKDACKALRAASQP